ncbi:MAG: hypothetical protein AAB853_03250 [Patescibacteria group bacterium]
MAFLTVPLALLLIALEGALLLRIVERSQPYFYRVERLAAGFLVGSALSAFILFFAVYFGILPLSFTGFAIGHGMIIGVLLLIFFLRFGWSGFSQFSNLNSHTSTVLSVTPIPRWALLLGAFLLLFALLKIVAVSTDLLLTPAYFDDVYANWNMRAKVFYLSESLLLDLPPSHELFFGGRVPSYPLTMYFTKVFAVMSAGGWSEAAANGVNLAFFLVLLILFVSALRREAGSLWGTLGLILLLSFPLLLTHATAAYSDIAMAGGVLLLATLLRAFFSAGEERRRAMLLRLLGVTIASMVFLKSEALLLYFPPLAFFLLGGSLKNLRDGKLVAAETWPFFAIVASVALPWVLFKLRYGLAFGNAQQIGGFSLAPHAEVIPAITNDLLYTGSYLLFFPVFILLLSLMGRRFSRTSFLPPLLFLGAIFLGQCLLYYLTPLALEAIRHTGFGRGVLQLLPSFAFFAVLLLRDLLGDSGAARGGLSIQEDANNV